MCSKREVVKVLKTMMISLICRKYSSVAMARITPIFANIEELFTVFVSHFLNEINKERKKKKKKNTNNNDDNIIIIIIIIMIIILMIITMIIK